MKVRNGSRDHRSHSDHGETADGEIANEAGIYSLARSGKGKGGTSSRPTLRKSLGAKGGAPSLLFGVGNQSFNELTLVAGGWPHGKQIAVDETTMSRNNLRLGEVVGVTTTAEPLERFTIVGETRFGNVGSIGGATLIDMDLRTAQMMTGEVGQYDQISVMAEPGISQKDLVRRIKTRIPPSLRSRVQVKTGEETANSNAAQIADALAYGHRRGVVHCDVKPQNALMDETGRPKLVDFGISRSLATTGALTDTVTGTAGYIAPEQLEGERLDGRDKSQVANVVLLTSELVTNAVVHPRGVGDSTVGLRLTIYGDRVRVEVEDCGEGFDRVAPVAPDSERGRGLFLVDQFSERWGSGRVQTEAGSRFRVWFELDWRAERTQAVV